MTSDPASRRAALVAGSALLAVAVLAGLGNLVAIQPAIDPDDPARTAANIAAGATAFRVGILALLGAAGLDIVVAWALRALFTPVSAGLATLAAWFRLGYAAVFVAAIGRLMGAARARAAA